MCVCVCVCVCVCARPVAQSSPTLCDPMDCRPPGSSVHEIPQARILEWVAITSPGDLPDPGIKLVSLASLALASEFFTTVPGSLVLTPDLKMITVKLNRIYFSKNFKFSQFLNNFFLRSSPCLSCEMSTFHKCRETHSNAFLEN